jgi:hypothetical protein
LILQEEPLKLIFVSEVLETKKHLKNLDRKDVLNSKKNKIVLKEIAMLKKV